jgi:hypothetical protein
MNLSTLDLEQEIQSNTRSRFHNVIRKNCVHATKAMATTCRQLKDALAEHGILILSEVTWTIDCYYLYFGLIVGCWHVGNGTVYPLFPAAVWMEALSEACFASFGFSKGS